MNLKDKTESIKYYVHYLFEEDGSLDCVFISHHETVFSEQVIEFSFEQFKSFIKTVTNVDVQWSREVMTPTQWEEYYTEKYQ